MIQQVSKVGSPGEVVSCAHHWLIEGSAGHESRGECKLCHEVRYFMNSEGVGLRWGDAQTKVSWERRKERKA